MAKLGVYVGTAKDVTCPGDHVTYEIILKEKGKCELECIPQLSYFKGGQPPWHVEGTWEMDGDDEVLIGITKNEMGVGPKKDQDYHLPLKASGNLEFRKTICKWNEPPRALDAVEVLQEKARKEREEAERIAAEQAKLARQAEEELEKERAAIKAEQERQAAAVDAQREELRRMREEMRRQQEEQEEAMRKEMEDLQRQQDERRKQMAAAEAERQRKLEEEQAELQAAKLKSVQEQAALQRLQLEAEEKREDIEVASKATTDSLNILDQDMKSRLEALQKAEEELRKEQAEMHNNRSKLMVVQAHVMNMMHKVGTKGEADKHDLGDDDEGAENDAAVQDGQDDDVWDVDWTVVSGGKGS